MRCCLLLLLAASSLALRQEFLKDEWLMFEAKHEHNKKYAEGNTSNKLAMNQFGDMIGALESQQFVKTGKLVPLSAQNVVDCGRMFHNRNCDGGFMDSAYGYIKVNGGIDSEESYPYVGVKPDFAFDPTGVVATVSSFVNIRSAIELTLKTKLATVGPMCAFIDNRLSSFILYLIGVYHDPKCAKDTTNHAVLIVGYGATEKARSIGLQLHIFGLA